MTLTANLAGPYRMANANDGRNPGLQPREVTSKEQRDPMSRPLSSKNPHFQNEANCKVYLNENKKSYLYQRLRT